MRFGERGSTAGPFLERLLDHLDDQALLLNPVKVMSRHDKRKSERSYGTFSSPNIKVSIKGLLLASIFPISNSKTFIECL